MKAWLVFLGALPDLLPPPRLVVPSNLAVGVALELKLIHIERWRRTDASRVIVGSEPDWADLLLQDHPLTIPREHARFYLNHADPPQSDFRAMKNCPVRIDGRLRRPFEWIKLPSGAEIELSCWRFRYEWFD